MPFDEDQGTGDLRYVQVIISGISISFFSIYGRFCTPVWFIVVMTFSIDGCYDAQYITTCPWEIQKWFDSFLFFFVVSLIKWDWKKSCWVWILVSGKVQVSLVWNSRNEKSHNADKLQALSSVSFSWFLSLVLLNCSAIFTYMFLICSFCGERVDPTASFTWSILSGLTSRHQPTMWVLCLGQRLASVLAQSFYGKLATYCELKIFCLKVLHFFCSVA